MNNIKLDTIIRTVCLVLALVNQCLTMTGHNPLPIEDEQVKELLSLVFTIFASVWAWWKNNSFTQAAIAADEVMHVMKLSGATAIEIEEVYPKEDEE